MWFAYVIYNFIWLCLLPFLAIFLIRTRRHTKWQEHFSAGLADIKLSDKQVIWIHTASMGETQAISYLLSLLEESSQYNILITQTTQSGRDLAAKICKSAILYFLPYELPFFLKRFYKTFRPSIALIVETEIWPNLLRYAPHNMPILLINARLSVKSYHSYKRMRWFFKRVINRFNAIICQSEETREHFLKLGYIGNNYLCNNTKFDSKVPFGYENILKDLQLEKIVKPIIVFASTKSGEENLIFALKEVWLKKYFLIIVPRNLERVTELEQSLKTHHINYLKRSSNQTVGEDTDILLGDSFNELYGYYHYAKIVVMGGSFLNFGGQNPIEPLRLKKPVIFGLYTFNFKEIYKSIGTYHCGVEVSSMQECFLKIDDLLNDKTDFLLMEKNSSLFLENLSGGTLYTLNIIKQYLQ